jgi:hypothetical protein
MDEKLLANLKKKWLRYGAISMLLIGFGVSLIGEAIILKSNGANVMQWVALGTVALIVFNAGICVFGEAVVCRSRFLNCKK